MRALSFGVATAILLPFLMSFAQEREDLGERIEKIGREALSGDVGGLSIVVAFEDHVFLAEGWGYADTERSEAASGDSAYRAGAMTAPFLAVAALQLADQGKLDLEAKITEYLPGLPYEEEGITVQHLLTHSSGIPSYTDLLSGASELDPETVLKWLGEGPLEATPGECALFSNTNVLLLGWIVEKVGGVTVPEYLERNVFALAGMEDTEYCSDGPTIREQAPIRQEFGGGIEDHSGAPQPFAADALCTTAADLVRFQRALVERTLIGEASFERLTTPILLSDGEQAPHGWGMNATSLDGFSCASAGGSMSGSCAHIAYYPEMDMTIAVLGNGEDAPVRNIERRIARAVFELPEPGIQDLPLEARERQRYLGEYAIGCTTYVIAEADERLLLSPPEGPEHLLFYQGKHVFRSKDDHDVLLTFELEGERAIAFVLEEYGIESRATRVN